MASCTAPQSPPVRDCVRDRKLGQRQQLGASVWFRDRARSNGDARITSASHNSRQEEGASVFPSMQCSPFKRQRRATPVSYTVGRIGARHGWPRSMARYPRPMRCRRGIASSRVAALVAVRCDATDMAGETVTQARPGRCPEPARGGLRDNTRNQRAQLCLRVADPGRLAQTSPGKSPGVVFLLPAPEFNSGQVFLPPSASQPFSPVRLAPPGARCVSVCKTIPTCSTRRRRGVTRSASCSPHCATSWWTPRRTPR